MILTLMHRTVPVARLEYDNAASAFIKILDVENLDHFPVGVVHKGLADRTVLNRWWRSRSIPASRTGLQEALETLGVASTDELLEKCYGLSLSDQYWVQPLGSDLAWEKINFFDNPFSEDVGDLLLGQKMGGALDLVSPDNSSDGWLRKKWTIQNGRRYLLKGGSGTIQQEPYNEVLASRIMERLGIAHATYTMVQRGNSPMSACEDFITRDTDLVPAYRLLQTQKQRNDRSDYDHFCLCCAECGISNVPAFLNQMLVVDYLIVNGDRHWNNFGVIRDAQTLEYLRMAPIYDSGASLWYNVPTQAIDASAENLPAKPFRKAQDSQLELVSSFDWFVPESLYGLGDELWDIFENAPTIDVSRRDVLCRAIEKRAELLLARVLKRCSRAPLASHIEQAKALQGKQPHQPGKSREDTFNR